MSAISTDLPAPDEQPPLEETVETPLKPGKRYGVLSVLCGLYPILAIAYCFMVIFLVQAAINSGSMSPPGTFLTFIIFIPFHISPLIIIAGIVFGIWGRKTEGRRYAIIGLVLSSLSALLVFAIVAFIAYRILVPCC